VVLGEDRRLRLANHYPVATRRRKTAKSFGNRARSTRFGTEGSVVRIHSPRPLFDNPFAPDLQRRHDDGRLTARCPFPFGPEIRSKESISRPPRCRGCQVSRPGSPRCPWRGPARPARCGYPCPDSDSPRRPVADSRHLLQQRINRCAVGSRGELQPVVLIANEGVPPLGVGRESHEVDRIDPDFAHARIRRHLDHRRRRRGSRGKERRCRNDRERRCRWFCFDSDGVSKLAQCYGQAMQCAGDIVCLASLCITLCSAKVGWHRR
jgi:hypothetical protein